MANKNVDITVQVRINQNTIHITVCSIWLEHLHQGFQDTIVDSSYLLNIWIQIIYYLCHPSPSNGYCSHELTFGNSKKCYFLHEKVLKIFRLCLYS